MSYEGDMITTETSGAGTDPSSQVDVGLSRSPSGVDTDDNSFDFIVACITPGAENACDAFFCTGIGACTDVSLEIQTDNSGSETTWAIIPDGGCEPVCTGGPYADGMPILINELFCSVFKLRI